MNILLDAIERKDAHAIKDEFSVYARESIPDILLWNYTKEQ